jgi:hypothetical protein
MPPGLEAKRSRRSAADQGPGEAAVRNFGDQPKYFQNHFFR